MLDCFSTREVVERTGISARQLQWWDEKRIVVPMREGRQRVYSAANLAEIIIIGELRKRQVSLRQVRHILRFLRCELDTRLAEMIWGEGDHHLLFDERHVYLATDPAKIIDLMRDSRQPMLLLSLEDALLPLRLDKEGMAAMKKGPETDQPRGESRRHA